MEGQAEHRSAGRLDCRCPKVLPLLAGRPAWLNHILQVPEQFWMVAASIDLHTWPVRRLGIIISLLPRASRRPTEVLRERSAAVS